VAITTKTNGVLIKARGAADNDAILSPGDAKGVRRGEKQLKHGDSKPWAVVKNVLSR
jgi:hypothetical protein